MIVGDQLSIVNFQRIIADLARNAQNLTGIVFGRARVPCLNVAERHLGKSEAPGDLSKKTLFVGMKDSKASDWDILYSYGMPDHPTDAIDGWVFSFPEGRDNCVSKKDAECPSVHYVTTKYTGIINKGAIVYVAGKIEADPDVVWNYHFEKANVCNSPARTHVMLQIKNDDLTASDGRYWSNPIGLTLANGLFTLKIPVTEGNWINVDGEFNKEGFDKMLKNMGNVGFTFGGGCFFGHGVSVLDSKAKFYVTNFTIKGD